jgi:alanine dehydrogenase
MLCLSASDLAARLDRKALIDALDDAFAKGCRAPPRQFYDLGAEPRGRALLALMPAWRSSEETGIKLVTVFADNAARALPAVHASYVLFCGETGRPLAVMDGTELTLRRTAAASALAARYLAPPGAARLLMVGTGNLAPHVIESHALVRPIEEVRIWGRDPAKAEALAARFRDAAFRASAVRELADAVGWADVISCATLSSEPLVRGTWLRGGQHLDLIGSFRADMHEADQPAVARAEIYVDTREGALAESGELIAALASGALKPDQVRADLAQLARGQVRVLRDANTVTLFKSVGAALEDLAAARLALRAERAAS